MLDKISVRNKTVGFVNFSPQFFAMYFAVFLERDSERLRETQRDSDTPKVTLPSLGPTTLELYISRSPTV